MNTLDSAAHIPEAPTGSAVTPSSPPAAPSAERQLNKHRRYYERHRDALRLAAHRRYYLRVHNTSTPPPVRTYVVTVPSPSSSSK